MDNVTLQLSLKNPSQKELQYVRTQVDLHHKGAAASKSESKGIKS